MTESNRAVFLIPVVIDQTSEADERVPDRFREVQWTRLPGGETSPAFVARIAALLDQSGASAGKVPASAAPAPATPSPPTHTPKRGPFVPALAVVAAVLLVGAGAWLTRHRWLQPPPIVPYSAEDRRMTYAILPFQASGNDAHAAQVAAATADEIRGMLESRRELVSLASPGSVEQAMAHEVSMKKLAQALDVHFILRRAVTRGDSGYKVNISCVAGENERVIHSGGMMYGHHSHRHP